MTTLISPHSSINAASVPRHDEETRTRRLDGLQQSIRKAWRLLIAFADDGSNLLELPAGQLRCLRRIMENEGCKLIDVARETNLSLPNASRLVDRLVQREFVVRETDPSDRRAIRLYVTPEARGMIDQIDSKRMDHLRAMTEQLSAAQIDQAVEQFQLVISAAERSRALAAPEQMSASDRDGDLSELPGGE